MATNCRREPCRTDARGVAVLTDKWRRAIEEEATIHVADVGHW